MQDTVVGVNKYRLENEDKIDVLRIDNTLVREQQITRLNKLKKEFPNLPLILDPSHICGRRDTILDVSQTALDLNYDGFMIETHIDPDNAWSDAKQQITPARLKEIIKELVIRKQTSSEETFQQKLNIYRDDLDKLDNHLLALLKSRMDISEQIGLLKRSENVAILQSARWEEILKSMHEEANKKGLSQEFVSEIFKAIHVESIKKQQQIK